VDEAVRLYETMLLIDPRLDTPQADAVVERFGALVTDRGGATESVDRWGRRKLAYEIDKLQEGFYAVVTYQLDPTERKGLEEALPFVEGLIRTKTVFPQVRTRRIKT
jgi:small subunit ribosomal protein S6